MLLMLETADKSMCTYFPRAFMEGNDEQEKTKA